jgi:hypothetical protein
MGSIHFSLDLELVQALRKSLPLQVFVETGTFPGVRSRALTVLRIRQAIMDVSSFTDQRPSNYGLNCDEASRCRVRPFSLTAKTKENRATR